MFMKYVQIVRDDALFKSLCIFLNCSNFTQLNSRIEKNTIGENYVLTKTSLKGISAKVTIFFKF